MNVLVAFALALNSFTLGLVVATVADRRRQKRLADARREMDKVQAAATKRIITDLMKGQAA